MTNKEKAVVRKLIATLRKELENTFRVHGLWDSINEVEKLVGIPVRINVMTAKQIKNMKRRWAAEDKKRKQKRGKK